LFADSEVLAIGAECHGGYSLGAFDARNELLGLVIDVVEDDVVTARVAYRRVVEPEMVSTHVSLMTEEELGGHRQGISWSRGLLL
jgi:hypothetical protein